MDVAIIGATGSCGRQLCAQLLQTRVLTDASKMQLVGRRGGSSERELWGFVCDLTDAFEEVSPKFEVVLDPEEVDADIVVMLAGATIRAGSRTVADRAQLGRQNRVVFETYADALSKQSRNSIVIVQSNPVELGVKIFAQKLGRQRVLGAGALSDTLRFKSELARVLGIRRNLLMSPVFGQHGDHMVPIYSQIHARGVPRETIDELVKQMRKDHTLKELPDRIRQGKAQAMELIDAEKWGETYAYIAGLCPDLGAAIRPFFTHFTSGRTTEMATAHSVAELVRAFAKGAYRAIPAQVMFEGEWLGIHGVVAGPVVLGPTGWMVFPMDMEEDEVAAVRASADAIRKANDAVLSS